ncbi:helix-turn-helix domain-containing protein [Sphingobacterium bovistauri]|uniref:Helix-turn-helix transcriptional regulator n=1 Tax=Sphingobacterium bovistauri TaxID=2781959 RepID=A0ABS7ZBR6_9SPHI|nr:response regulator transcription factor [Sphingobacterium bovistauri]MCA5006164.1 helix-turn-helix transcriptional regulator [Sphingobacterium bovistauri]
MTKRSDNHYIPEIFNFEELSKHLGVEAFMYKDVYFEKISCKADLINTSAKPFKHHFYAISLILDGHGTFNAGFWKSKIKRNIIYFKSPYQIVSWNFDPDIIKKYAIVFTENFIHQHSELANIIFDFQFLQIDKTIPLHISDDDVIILSNIFESISKLYNTKSNEQFNLIAAYVKILLLIIRQIYDNSIAVDKELNSTVDAMQVRIINNFFLELKNVIDILGEKHRDYTVNYFAQKLSIHPNHLNATLKKYTGKSTQEHIHQEIVNIAKTLLSHTNLSIKEIAFRLSFNEQSHFSNFFKKKVNKTPLQFKKENRI